MKNKPQLLRLTIKVKANSKILKSNSKSPKTLSNNLHQNHRTIPISRFIKVSSTLQKHCQSCRQSGNFK